MTPTEVQSTLAARVLVRHTELDVHVHLAGIGWVGTVPAMGTLVLLDWDGTGKLMFLARADEIERRSPAKIARRKRGAPPLKQVVAA